LSKHRVLADENIPKTVIKILREKGYNVIAIYEIIPGMNDEEVIELAIKESRIIITFDKEFGRIALLNPNITGIILLRIPPSNPIYIAERLISVLEKIDNLYNKLVIIRRRSIKIIPLRT